MTFSICILFLLSYPIIQFLHSNIHIALESFRFQMNNLFFLTIIQRDILGHWFCKLKHWRSITLCIFWLFLFWWIMWQFFVLISIRGIIYALLWSIFGTIIVPDVSIHYWRRLSITSMGFLIWLKIVFIIDSINHILPDPLLFDSLVPAPLLHNLMLHYLILKDLFDEGMRINLLFFLLFLFVIFITNFFWE